MMKKINIAGICVVAILVSIALSTVVYAENSVERITVPNCSGNNQQARLRINLDGNILNTNYIISEVVPDEFTIVGADNGGYEGQEVGFLVVAGAVPGQSYIHNYYINVPDNDGYQVTYSGGEFMTGGMVNSAPIGDNEEFTVYANICVVDNDGDGYADENNVQNTCGCISRNLFDCDDTNADVNPGQQETMDLCGNGIDEDCVGGDRVCPGEVTRVIPESVQVNLDFDVTLNVNIVNEDFYAIDEVIPSGFTVADPGTGTESTIGEETHIRWVVSSGAESTSHQYTLNAPGEVGVRNYAGSEYLLEGMDNPAPIGGDTQINMQGGCTPGAEPTGIVHSSYADGQCLGEPAGAAQWTIVIQEEAQYCYSDHSAKTADALLTPEAVPDRVLITSPVITVGGNVQNSGELDWCFLTETSIDTERCAGTLANGICYYSDWRRLVQNVEEAVSFNNIELAPACTDGQGTNREWTGPYNVNLETWSDQWAYSGTRVSELISNVVDVVDCIDDNDCATCSGEGWNCNNPGDIYPHNELYTCCTVIARNCKTYNLDNYCGNNGVAPSRPFCSNYRNDYQDKNNIELAQAFGWERMNNFIGQESVVVDSSCMQSWEAEQPGGENELYIDNNCIEQAQIPGGAEIVIIDSSCISYDGNQEHIYVIDVTMLKNFAALQGQARTSINSDCIRIRDAEVLRQFNNEDLVQIGNLEWVLPRQQLQDNIIGLISPRYFYIANFLDNAGVTNYVDVETQETMYAACPVNTEDTQCCVRLENCVYDGSCYPEGSVINIPDGDNVKERCVAESPGEWDDDIEYNCIDEIDNDGDGFTDSEDTDCNSIITGRVKDASVTPPEEMEAARVDVISQDISYFTYTGEEGYYELNVKSIQQYDVVASKEGYAPSFSNDFYVEPARSIHEIDFDLQLGESPCLPDCTMPPRGTCDPKCEFMNNCYYYSEQAKNVCADKMPGFRVDYGDGREIICCGHENQGGPYGQVERESAEIDEEAENIAVTRRIVMYNGEPVSLVALTHD